MSMAPRYLSLFLISAALLFYELLLMRLLATAYWGHFASFVISVSMLGLAGAGLFLHFLRHRVEQHPEWFRGWASLAFAITAPLGFLSGELLPFQPFLLAWSVGEYAALAGRILIFFVPFFAAGVAIGVPFVARLAGAGRLYLFNMGGSAAAAVPLWLALHVWHPQLALLPVTAAAAGAAVTARPGRKFRWLTAASAVLVTWWVWQSDFRFSEFKELSQTKTLPETEVLAEYPHPRGLVHVVRSDFTRYHPGLSMQFAGVLPPSKLLFVDGDGMQVVYAADDVAADSGFLEATLESYTYRRLERPEVLLLRASPPEILRAWNAGSRRIDAVLSHPLWPGILRESWEADGKLPETLTLVYDDPRRYLDRRESSYDFIHASLLAGFAAGAAGAASLDADSFLTREGLGAVWRSLNPGAHALFTAWIENPPRAGVRLTAQILDMLEAEGVDQPGEHLLAMRGWSTMGIFVFKNPPTEVDIVEFKALGQEHGFDLVYYPGITPGEVNRLHYLPEAPYYSAFVGLMEDRERFAAQWPFLLEPTRDNRPFFGHHFRWAALPELISEMGMEWLPFVEWGYLLQVGSLVVATVLGFFLLLLPAALSRARTRLRVAGLFLMLGVGYMLVEIWAILRLIQIFGDPLLASTLVITVMLASSGLGALVLSDQARSVPLWLGALGISLVVAVLLAAVLASHGGTWPEWVRLVMATLLVGLPAFLMGFPFPYALDHIVKGGEIPWALALNGFGSVVGSLGAVLLAVHFGFHGLLLSGAAVYFVAAACLRRGA